MTDQLEDLKQRCLSAGLSAEIVEKSERVVSGKPNRIRRFLWVKGPRSFAIFADHESLSTTFASKFEHCRFVEGYEAIWSEKLGFVECELSIGEVPIEQAFLCMVRILEAEDERALWDRYPSDEDDAEYVEELAFSRVKLREYSNGARVSVGWSSMEFSTLSHDLFSGFPPQLPFFSGDRRPFPERLTVRVEGVDLPDSETAREVLLRCAEPVLFQVDVNLHYVYERAGRPFALKRYPPPGAIIDRPDFEYKEAYLSRGLMLHLTTGQILNDTGGVSAGMRYLLVGPTTRRRLP
jgi:hypothetical protein